MKPWQRLSTLMTLGIVGANVVDPIKLISDGISKLKSKKIKPKGIDELGDSRATILSMISCMAKLCNIDGHVSWSEFKLIEDFLKKGLNLDEEAVNHFFHYFDKSLEDDASFIEYVGKYGELVQYKHDYCMNFVMFIFTLAHIDGDFNQTEQNAIKEAIDVLQLPPTTYDTVLCQYRIDKLFEKTNIDTVGSGFFINNKGFIITNHHVVDNCKKIKIRSENDIFDAEVISIDQDNDLCLLHANKQKLGLVFNSAPIYVGQEVLTYGFPDPAEQGFAPKMTQGIVSSINGHKDDVRRFQFDAAIQPGNSGGPLIDKRTGVLLGVSFASLVGSQNVNYAIKNYVTVNFLKEIPSVKDSIAYNENQIFDQSQILDRLSNATVQIFNCK